MLLDLYQCTVVSSTGRCGGKLSPIDGSALVCDACGHQYPVFKGIPIFRDEPLEQLERESDYKKRNRTSELANGWYKRHRDFLQLQISKHGLNGPMLDVGCGNGLLAPALSEYIGVEYALPALLDPGWGSEERSCGDAQVLPFQPESFGLIVSVNVFEHIPRIDQVYSELQRVLRRGGVMLLRPAWHSLRSITELIPIKPYSALTFRQKITKALFPVQYSKPYKVATRIPSRLFRRAFTRGPQPMKWTPLTAYRHPNNSYSLDKWMPDTDAAASIDPHETIMYFVRRGYECLSHPNIAWQICARGVFVVLRKPM
jgi:SAM-dependent methyltransferase